MDSPGTTEIRTSGRQPMSLRTVTISILSTVMLSAGLLMVSTAKGLAQTKRSGSEHSRSSSASVIDVKGDVRTRIPGKSNSRPVSEGNDLAPGEILQIRSGSRLRVRCRESGQTWNVPNGLTAVNHWCGFGPSGSPRRRTAGRSR